MGHNLRQLYPNSIEGVNNDSYLLITEKHIDEAESDAVSIVDEYFPQTAVETISDWERIFDITPTPGDSIDNRHKILLSHWVSKGSLRRSKFEDIARSLGYTIGNAGSADPHIRFVDGEYRPFIADCSIVGDLVYDDPDGRERYIVSVRGTSVSTNSILKSQIQRYALFGLHIQFINE